MICLFFKKNINIERIFLFCLSCQPHLVMAIQILPKKFGFDQGMVHLLTDNLSIMTI